MRLAVLIAVELSAVPVLARLGSVPFLSTPGLSLAAWGSWLQRTAPEDAVASVLRLVATGCTWWLLANTLAYLAARTSRLPGLLRALAWTTPAPVRRLVDSALALSLVATLASGGAALAATPSPPPPPPPVVGGQAGIPLPAGLIAHGPASSPLPVPIPAPISAPTPTPGVRPQAKPGSGSQPESRPTPPVLPRPATPPRAGSRPPSVNVHKVAPGDNLWSIAAERLRQGGGHGPPDVRVARYWHAVVGENQPRLRSGNPDLIFPGEDISLPPTT